MQRHPTRSGVAKNPEHALTAGNSNAPDTTLLGWRPTWRCVSRIIFFCPEDFGGLWREVVPWIVHGRPTPYQSAGEPRESPQLAALWSTGPVQGLCGWEPHGLRWGKRGIFWLVRITHSAVRPVRRAGCVDPSSRQEASRGCTSMPQVLAGR